MARVEAEWLEGADSVTQAAGVTARALRDSPSAVAISTDPLQRFDMLHRAFSAALAVARVAGIRQGRCVLGVAGAVPPGHCVGAALTPELRTLEVPDANATDADRFLYSASIMARHDPLEPHWHVGPVGVEPGFQSMGLGRAAMGLLCDEFDQYGRLAWLETDKPGNVPFYRGLGFELMAEEVMLDARYWFMRRRPKEVGTRTSSPQD